jgi:hypothetical protein
MNKNLQKKTIKEAQKLQSKVEKATQKNVLLRQNLEDKMLAVQKKLTPLLNQRDAINRSYTQLDKPTAESIVFSEYVALISRTPQAYGFKDAEEVIAKLINL